MKSVNTTGLMLGMLALGGLVAVGAIMTGQAAFAQLSPFNAATASNSDDDSVGQSATGIMPQIAVTTCEIDCDTTQTGTITPSNTNTDNDVLSASALACQALSGTAAASNICGNEELLP